MADSPIFRAARKIVLRGQPFMSTPEWDATLYTAKHSFVYEFGRELVALLAPQKGERILDLGCGSGQLTQAIAESGARVTGLDSSASMIDRARGDYPELSFVLADAKDFYFEEPFDAVFSNAALHWVKPPEKVIERVAKCLRPGGRFVAELGGKGNVRGIFDAAEAAGRELTGREVGNVNYFPSIAEYSTILESFGLEVRQAWLFDRPTKLEDGENGLRNWLTMFGEKTFGAIPDDVRSVWIERTQQKARTSLFRDGSWYADYRRLRVIGVRT
jgi:trans-aconitate methyltransferase